MASASRGGVYNRRSRVRCPAGAIWELCLSTRTYEQGCWMESSARSRVSSSSAGCGRSRTLGIKGAGSGRRVDAKYQRSKTGISTVLVVLKPQKGGESKPTDKDEDYKLVGNPPAIRPM
ncbi:jg27461 [Pararge aegeria aegeria]|uniref:Jg27461 protein n=1 Tax=Pararge aegeria aegeria TaxID=348720 RepID=A0A8S4QPM9_9NEOP|nr:jg27461 [Pararge aegeria aegeria]